MSILDHPLIGMRYFFPRRDAPEDGVRVRGEAGELVCASRPLEGAPTFLFFHGNGEVVADYLPWYPPLVHARGAGVFFAEYRGYGGSEGHPALVGMLDDVPAMVEAAGGPEQVIAFGRSVGSIYAIEAAARFPELRGLVLESGIADPLQRILLRVAPEELDATLEELEREAAERLDHEAKLRAYKGPGLVLHARGDSLVTFDHGQRLAAWLGEGDKGRRRPTRLVAFDRGDHNTVFSANSAAYLAALEHFTRPR